MSGLKRRRNVLGLVLLSMVWDKMHQVDNRNDHLEILMRNTVIGATLAFVTLGHADTLALWDFNSDDANVATGTLSPSSGAGSLSAWNTSSTFFTSGSPNDPASFPLDSGWSVGGYPAQGVGSNTVGLASFVSTVGFGAVTLSFDVKNQPSANKWFSVNLTTNGGSTWSPHAIFSIDQPDTWTTRTFDLTSVAGVANNAGFGFQVLAIFKPGTSEYEASEAGYNGDFGAVYDFVSVNASAVPGPAALVPFILGMTGVARRRKRV